MSALTYSAVECFQILISMALSRKIQTAASRKANFNNSTRFNSYISKRLHIVRQQIINLLINTR